MDEHLEKEHQEKTKVKNIQVLSSLLSLTQGQCAHGLQKQESHAVLQYAFASCSPLLGCAQQFTPTSGTVSTGVQDEVQQYRSMQPKLPQAAPDGKQHWHKQKQQVQCRS